MVRRMIAVVAASDLKRGIGYNGKLPWSLAGDMQHFKKVTTTVDSDANPSAKNAVVMGRKTWESIPPKFRPLKGRINVVLTRSDPKDHSFPDHVLVASSLQDAHDKLETLSQDVAQIFVIGGDSVYRQALQEGWVDRVIYTQVSNLPGETEFDSYFPQLPQSEWIDSPFDSSDSLDKHHDDKENATSTSSFYKGGSDGSDWLEDAKSGIRYRFLEFRKRTNCDPSDSKTSTTASESPLPATASSTTTDPSASLSSQGGASGNPEEEQYLDLCRRILETGARRTDRTGTGTLSIFGTQMRFDLRGGKLPLLTTKRTFWRGVAEELLWFISGNTNANELAAKDVHIWDDNGSREFLDQRGLGHREQGDLGPVYGFQWRHFGAKYVDMHTDYTGQGVDQLADCIHKIRHQPHDRRIVMSAWNPSDLELMALPPCHMFCQFYVDTEKNELSCQMYQRSADMGLGVPFNIASYALLTHMMAHVTGRKPGDFVHTIGDAHIYLNHIEPLQEQLTREPRPFPTLTINPDKKNIDDFVFDDFQVIGYNPHKSIKMKMAV